MSSVSKARLRILVVVAVAILVFGVVKTFGPFDSLPRLRASARSPDGKLTVKVFRQMLQHFPSLRVGLFVRVYNDQEKLIYERKIFEDGWWDEDFGEMYKNIVFDGEEIRIGPKFDAADYFVIRKSELGNAKAAGGS